MKRKGFYSKKEKGATGDAGLQYESQTPASEEYRHICISDKWYQPGKGRVTIPEKQRTLNFDVAVIGGGLPGISAAVSASENGAPTILIQDRPVLGGNVTVKKRVTLDGVKGLQNDYRVERETELVEEILVENWYFNPKESYPLWDHILYRYVSRHDKLELMLNTKVVDVIVKEDTINSLVCWQSTSETEFRINARRFIDCSEDGLRALLSGW